MKNNNSLSFNRANRENTIRPRNFKSPFQTNKSNSTPTKSSFKWKWVFLVILIIIVIISLAVGLGVGLKEKFLSQKPLSEKDNEYKK